MAGTDAPVGVAVLGAGMTGAAHATACLLQRTASGERGVPVRLIAGIEADRDAAEALRRRFGRRALVRVEAALRRVPLTGKPAR